MTIHIVSPGLEICILSYLLTYVLIHFLHTHTHVLTHTHIKHINSCLNIYGEYVTIHHKCVSSLIPNKFYPAPKPLP